MALVAMEGAAILIKKKQYTNRGQQKKKQTKKMNHLGCTGFGPDINKKCSNFFFCCKILIRLFFPLAMIDTSTSPTSGEMNSAKSENLSGDFKDSDY